MYKFFHLPHRPTPRLRTRRQNPELRADALRTALDELHRRDL